MFHLDRSSYFTSKMCQGLDMMRSGGMFTDLNIKVRDGIIPCHKVIVSVHSPVLYRMILANERGGKKSHESSRGVTESHEPSRRTTKTHEPSPQTTETHEESRGSTQSNAGETPKPPNSTRAEKTKDQIELKNVHLQTMETVMEYMYWGRFERPLDQFEDLLVASHRLSIYALKEWCEEQATTLVTPANAIRWLHVAHRLHLDTVKQYIMLKFLNTTSDDQLTPELKQRLQEIQRRYDESERMLSVREPAQKTLTDCPSEHAELGKTGEAQKPAEQTSKATRDTQIQEPKENAKQAIEPTEGMQLVQAAARHGDTTEKPLIEERIVIVGGQVEGEVNRICWVVDIDSDPEQVVDFCPIPHDECVSEFHSVCATNNGFAIIGGDKGVRYDAATSSWSKIQTFPKGRSEHGSLCVEGVLHVFGGAVDGKQTKSVEYFDLNSGQIQSGPDTPIAVVYPKVGVINGEVYLLDEHTKQLMKMDSKKSAWQKLAPLPVSDSIYGCSMLVVDGRLLVAGGEGKVSAWYNPKKDTWNYWSIVEKLPQEVHYRGALVQFKDRVFLVGGRWYDTGTDLVEELNIETGSWSVVEWMVPAGLWGFHAMVLKVPHRKK